jgi:hypothetical protein
MISTRLRYTGCVTVADIVCYLRTDVLATEG